ncbi:hypothetical protein [Kibdelosporangium phytohabitans]|uniref:Uncharacterized protein n=1 Tax=Kibdelosporangium phytohabitans TaxID=860235 RepID=A0A0N9HRM3_9PSEU|nr:hypothetical protein [Kibdelosporangium phytohabitans]ALG05774.1 hypothetical protein AOZ06_01510 [Kibdelosporangium phytohabitans]MBE1466224.1 hypothetical protein [Kibdelosporangium phytohabitans]
MTVTRPFGLNERYDRDEASDGVSRYGAYLAQKRKLFLDFDDCLTADRLAFAAAAWEIAQSPIMSPPYVLAHPRIQSAVPRWDEEYRLAIEVVVAMPNLWPLPAQYRYRALGWREDSVWGGFEDPRDAGRLTVLPSLLVRVPVTAGDVMDPVYESGIPTVDAARGSVLAMCHLLNPVLASVLEQHR